RFDCDWSSDVCSSDLLLEATVDQRVAAGEILHEDDRARVLEDRLELCLDVPGVALRVDELPLRTAGSLAWMPRGDQAREPGANVPQPPHTGVVAAWPRRVPPPFVVNAGNAELS